VIILSSVIAENQSSGDGGGLYGAGGSLLLDSCVFRRNIAHWEGGGAAFLSAASEAAFRFCLFLNNYGYSDQGTTLFSGSPNLQMIRCTIIDSAQWDYHTVIETGNYGLINSCLFVGFQSQGTFAVPDASEARFQYSGFYGFEDSTLFSNGTPPGIGIIVTTNANGDSTDTYYNLFRDPLFVNADAGDYRLSAASPCIDAGDPALPPDPDGSVADIGAYPYDQSAVSAPPRPVAQRFALEPA